MAWEQLQHQHQQQQLEIFGGRAGANPILLALCAGRLCAWRHLGASYGTAGQRVPPLDGSR